MPFTHRGGHARAHEGQLPRNLQQPPLVHGPLLEDQLGVVVLLLRRYLAGKIEFRIYPPLPYISEISIEQALREVRVLADGRNFRKFSVEQISRFQTN